MKNNQVLITAHSYLGPYSLRTFIDNHKLYNNQNNKHDDTDNQITAAHEITERCHDISRITR